MYCKECGSNNAFQGHDVNFRREILCCPDCKSVTWPVPSLADLEKDVERIRERMTGIENMPELEED